LILLSKTCFVKESDAVFEFIINQEIAMSQAKAASLTPFAVDVEKGKDYWWCS